MVCLWFLLWSCDFECRRDSRVRWRVSLNGPIWVISLALETWTNSIRPVTVRHSWWTRCQKRFYAPPAAAPEWQILTAASTPKRTLTLSPSHIISISYFTREYQGVLNGVVGIQWNRVELVLPVLKLDIGDWINIRLSIYLSISFHMSITSYHHRFRAILCTRKYRTVKV